jgi:hypothetical protein
MRIPLLILATLLAPYAHAEHAETRSYVTGEGLAYIALTNVQPCDEVTLGGTCFAVQPGESYATLEIADASGLPTAANAQVTDATGATTLSVIFCAYTELELPPGSAHVHVAMYDSALGIAGCGLQSGGTTGTITATFA